MSLIKESIQKHFESVKTNIRALMSKTITDFDFPSEEKETLS